MPVYRLTGLLPWVLFNILLLFTGISGEESTVYSSLGDTVKLPCNHLGSLNCSSTAWTWNKEQSTVTIELVTAGVVNKENQEKSGRLRVGHDCSLLVNNLTTADVGLYYCRLYENKNKHKDADVIKLSLLKISASLPVTELRIGSTVTLVCELLSSGSCGKSLTVSWVSETGSLQGDRYKLSESKCSSNLTVTLERSDHNMKWRCQLTEEGKLKASHSYTIIFRDVSDENMREKEDKKEKERGPHIWIASVVAICVAVVLIVVLIMICRRRAVQRKMAGNHVSQSHTVTNQNKGENEDTVTYAVVNPSAGGKRKPDRESAVLETEYATIKTSQK